MSGDESYVSHDSRDFDPFYSDVHHVQGLIEVHPDYLLSTHLLTACLGKMKVTSWNLGASSAQLHPLFLGKSAEHVQSWQVLRAWPRTTRSLITRGR